jgi:hypothetical protein
VHSRCAHNGMACLLGVAEYPPHCHGAALLEGSASRGLTNGNALLIVAHWSLLLDRTHMTCSLRVAWDAVGVGCAGVSAVAAFFFINSRASSTHCGHHHCLGVGFRTAWRWAPMF